MLDAAKTSRQLANFLSTFANACLVDISTNEFLNIALQDGHPVLTIALESGSVWSAVDTEWQEWIQQVKPETRESILKAVASAKIDVSFAMNALFSVWLNSQTE